MIGTPVKSAQALSSMSMQNCRVFANVPYQESDVSLLTWATEHRQQKALA